MVARRAANRPVSRYKRVFVSRVILQRREVESRGDHRTWRPQQRGEEVVEVDMALTRGADHTREDLLGPCAAGRPIPATDLAIDDGGADGVFSNWRRQREAGALREMRGRRRGPTPRPVDPRVTQLEAENRRLQRKLQRAETIITLQKKVAEILGIPLTPLDDDETD